MTQESQEGKYDALIVGAGPAGATSAMLLARQGLNVLIIERATFPRFHIGESMLPRMGNLIEELGLTEAMASLPQVPKLGAEFVMGDGSAAMQFTFRSGLLPGAPTFNVERSAFDQMLLEQARLAGAKTRQALVKEILELEDENVRVRLDDGQIIEARWLLDCSGQSTLVGKHLNLRKPMPDRSLQKVAYFQHFQFVDRLPGDQSGYPSIVLFDEGWFWIIAINETTTSVGMVIHPDTARDLDVPANRMLRWGIARCPLLRQRMAQASGPELNHVAANFCYTCRPYAGPGYFLVGDSAAFLDPAFSTGATLAMIEATEAALLVTAMARGEMIAGRARSRYISLIEQSTGIFFRIIKGFYTHSFRELFLNGAGPLQVHKAIISVLAGQVFPRPAWALRWRVWFFHLCVWMNRTLPMVAHRKGFSLLQSPPQAWTGATTSEPEELLEATPVG